MTTRQPPPPLDPSRPFGRYDLGPSLGAGGVGNVYGAVLRGPAGFRKRVAIKVLRPDVVARVGAALDGFLAEARLGALLEHPNIVDVYELGEIDGRTFIAMEWVRGPTLSDLLRARALPPPALLLEMGLQIAAGLGHAHALRVDGVPAGLVHKDIKPGNVMVSRAGVVKVLDFGVAEPIAQPGAAHRSLLQGTPAYMSPEQLAGQPLDPRSDLFAVGLVLAELATGSRLIETGALDAVADHHRALPTTLARQTPLVDARVSGLSGVLERCLAPDRADRFADAGELEVALLALRARYPVGRRLKDWLDEVLPEEPAAPPPPPVPGPLDETQAVRGRPREADEFVGREAELGRLAGLLERRGGLVTVKGPGGTGKTRLVRRCAQAGEGRWTGGVFFCELASASTLEGFAQVVAASLGSQTLSGATAKWIAALGRAIEQRGPCLLVLDNFEQLGPEATEALAAWRQAAGQATFLITSRARLGLPDEQVLELAPLGPQDGVALFLARARAASPGRPPFVAAELEAVADLVRRVDGIPLAIELAAARSAALQPSQLLARMSARFRLLQSAGGTFEPRHSALRATLDWSWNLLEPWEQACFAQLSVFSGGFYLEAAEDVVRLPAWRDAPWVVDIVGALLDSSLLQSRRDAQDEPRFFLLETIAEYAAEKLADERAVVGPLGPVTGPHAAAGARERHQDHFARFGTRPFLRSLYASAGRRRQERLRPDMDNLLAAAERAAEDGRARQAAEAACGAAFLTLRVAPPARTIALAERVLAVPVPGPEASGHRESLGSLRARVLRNLALALSQGGHFDEAEAASRKSAALAQELGDGLLEAQALSTLASVLSDGGQLSAALRAHEEGLALCRRLGNRLGEAAISCNIGLLHARRGQRGAARVCHQQALEIHREIGNERGVATNLGNLGGLCLAGGELEQARALLEEAIALHEGLDQPRTLGSDRNALGQVLALLGEPDRALDEHEAALALGMQTGDRSLEGEARGLLGELALQAGALATAVEHLQAAVDGCEAVTHRSAARFRGALALARARQGRDAEAQALLEEQAARSISDYPELQALVLCRTGRARLLLGDELAARWALDLAARRLGPAPPSRSPAGGEMTALRRELGD